MKEIFNYIKEIFLAVKSLLTGMKVTGYYFFHRNEIVTQCYPENRKTLVMTERFKGILTMTHNQQNEHKCTACGICQNVCPNGTIEVIPRMEEIDGKMKKVLDRHVYNLGTCSFCGLCVKNCPTNALAFGQEFEHAVYNKEILVKELNMPGSRLGQTNDKEE